MKYRVEMKWVLEKYPEKCEECPAFYKMPYQCHNERGNEGGCQMGYMAHSDMRDFEGYTRFRGCRIESNPDVRIDPSLED